MILPYVIIISICLFLIFIFNSIFAGLAIYYCLLYTIANFVLVVVFDIVLAGLVHILPKKWFLPTRRFFTAKKWEHKFYNKIGIKKWKDYVPELGKLCNFRKDKLQGTEKFYLNKFLIETCYGEVVHYATLFAGLINLVFINTYFLNFALPVALTNMVLQIPPIFIQRYNRPKLLRVYNFKYGRIKTETEAANALSTEQVEESI